MSVLDDMKRKAQAKLNEIQADEPDDDTSIKEPASEPNVRVVSNQIDPDTGMPTYEYDKSKTVDQNATELIELKASSEAIKDADFINQVAEDKKAQVKASSESNKKIQKFKKEAESIRAETDKDIAYYEKDKFILQWGGIDERPSKALSTFFKWMIVPFYTISKIGISIPFAIVKTFLHEINDLLEEVTAFGKAAKRICFSVLVIGILCAVAYTILVLLNRFGIINIF